MSLALDDIKNFIKVSETKNITRASESLGLTQPALSYSIKRLENELGQELIVRLKNGVVLTKFGQAFLSKARKLIILWEESQKILTNKGEETKGEFSIGAHPSVALYSLSKILPKIYENFPRLDFKFEHALSREITEKVISWEVDFGIVINPIAHPDLVIHEITNDKVTLFSTGAKDSRLIYDPKLSQSTHIIGKLPPNLRENYIHSENLEVVAQLASKGLGVGLLPGKVAANFPKLKAIKDAPYFVDRLCLVYRNEKHQNIVSKSIIKLIKESFI